MLSSATVPESGHLLRWEWLVASPTTVPDSDHPLRWEWLVAAPTTVPTAATPFAGSGLSRHPPLCPTAATPVAGSGLSKHATIVGRGHDLIRSETLIKCFHTPSLRRLETETGRRSLVWSLCFHTRISQSICQRIHYSPNHEIPEPLIYGINLTMNPTTHTTSNSIKNHSISPSICSNTQLQVVAVDWILTVQKNMGPKGRFWGRISGGRRWAVLDMFESHGRSLGEQVVFIKTGFHQK